MQEHLDTIASGCDATGSELLHHLRAAGIVDPACTEVRPLPGGTAGRAWVVLAGGAPRYVIKYGDARAVTAETLFLEAARNLPLLPRVIHAEPSQGYYVYRYLPGRRLRRMPGKARIMALLVDELISRYPPAARCCGWGPVTGPRWPNWPDFLAARVEEAAALLGDILPPEDTALASALAAFPMPGDGPDDAPKLLHGDLGIHNLLFTADEEWKNEAGGRAPAATAPELSGVIDPEPLVGPPLYDLLFAFFSSPDGLEPDALCAAASRLLGPDRVHRARLLAHALPVLFCRIATCRIHHPDDLPDYLAAWRRFRAEID